MNKIKKTLTHLTLKSGNAKTGPIPVSTSPSATCPDACPFKLSGCYAKSGPLAIHWSKVTSGTRGMDWQSFLSAIYSLPVGQLWRHNQAGDLPGIGNKIDVKQLGQLVKASEGKRGFTYTHKPLSATNLKSIRSANAKGFTVNLSANSVAHADSLVQHGLPVAAVVPQSSPDRFVSPSGNRIVICPAQRIENMNCDKCRLCAKGNRGFIIGFRPHGPGARKVEAIVSR